MAPNPEERESMEEINRSYHRILGQIETIKELGHRIVTRELQFLTFFIVLIGAMASAFTVWSTDRVDSTVSKAENYIAAITGNLQPVSAEILDRTASRADAVLAGLSIIRQDSRTYESYLLRVSALFQVQIEGPPGTLLGSQTYIAGPWLDTMINEVLAREMSASEEIEAVIRGRLETASYNPSSESEMTIVESAPAELHFTLDLPFWSCEAASEALSEIIENRSDENLIFVRPVFRQIQNEPAFKSFNVKLFDNRLWQSCEDIDSEAR